MANAGRMVMPELLDPNWIVHCADDLLVINKPSGLLCQPGLGPALADSLITRVKQRWPQGQLVHRLDRDTSGLILIALTPELHRALSRLFAERQVLKRYIADVHGLPPETQGVIELPIAKRQHRPPLYGVNPAGKACTTCWRLLEVSPPNGQNPACSRLELEPRTGRSHQLRVHLSAIGLPIVGDPLYGAQVAVGSERLHLHACALELHHPLTSRSMLLEAPVPFAPPCR